MAEAELILGDLEAAGRAYQDAVDSAPEEKGAHKRTWTQACRLREKIGIDDATWKPIQKTFEDHE